MPVIPQYDATEQLDTDRRGMPRPDFSTMEAQALGGLGKSIAGVGSQIGEVAQRWAQQQQQQEEFTARVTEGRFQEDIERMASNAAMKMPENGFGFAQSQVAEFDKNSKDLLGQIPQRLRPQTEQRLALMRDRFHTSWAEKELKQAGTFSANELNKYATGAQAAVYNNPGELDGHLKEMGERVDLAPGLNTNQRQTIKQKLTATIKEVAADRIAGSDPQAMAQLLGVAFEQPARVSRGPTAGRMPGSERASVAVNAFRREGLPPLAAAAIAGNLVAESGVNPNARNAGDGRDGSDSIGVAQWNSSRATALKKYAEAQGKDWRDGNTQFGFLVQELKTSERGTYDRLVNARTIEEANAIAVGFFRPAGWSAAKPENAHNYAGRLNEARRAAGAAGDVPAAGAVDAGPGSSLPTVKPGEGGDPRFADLPFETKMRLVQQATAKQQRDLAVQDAMQKAEATRKEADRKVMVDELQFKATKGEVGLADVDLMWKQGAFKSFEEYNSVVKQVEKAQTDTSAYDRGVAMFNTPDFIFDPLSKDHKAALSAVDTKSGTIDRLQNADPRGAVEVSTRFAESGMVSQEAKGMFEGMIRGGNPSQLEYALQALDGMHRRNPNAFAEAFGSDTMKTLTMWQSSLDKSPSAFRDRLKTAMDPANAKARSEAEKVGRNIVGKMDDKQLLDIFDETWRFDPEKALGVRNSPGMGVLKEEYAGHFADGYASAQGDEAAAKTYADRMIKQTWARSPSSQGRVMKYAPETLPEAILPSVNGKRDWMKDQVEGAVRQKLGIRELEVDTFGVPLATAAKQYAGMVSRYSLVATPETRAEIDILKAGGALPNGRKSPAWMLVYQDASTGIFKEAAFYFDVEAPRAARQKRIEELSRQQQLAVDILNAAEARQADDNAVLRGGASRDNANAARRLGQERDSQDESDGADMRRRQRGWGRSQ